MNFAIKKAEPIDGRLLIAIAGPQASGKTTSALRLATGIVRATGGKICVIDTENSRALRYADSFNFNHMKFDPPFSPLRYLDAIDAATAAGYGEGDVIIIDSMSHEHEGPGGVLDMHETFLNDKAGNDWGKRERIKFTAWIKPKADRMRVILMGLQRNRAHVILCFRAKEKVKMVKSGGKTEVLNDGWQPIGGDEYFYEMDTTMILPPGSQGVPDWNENAARINEYPAGALVKKLHESGQLSEDVGAFLVQHVKKSAPNPLKTLAESIRDKIKVCESKEQLDAVMKSSASDLDKLKLESPQAHDFLMKAHDSMASSFTVEQVVDVGDGEPDPEPPQQDTFPGDL